MAYFAPMVDSSGAHIPTFADNLEKLKSIARSIFGEDIYLENDSADGQYLANLALLLSDVQNSFLLAYNNHAPQKAIGTALDSLLKLNGLQRKIPSYSTCIVTLTGTVGTVITNGVVQDLNGYKWDLPASVTIGAGGTVDETATCQTLGAITALPGDLSKISTPTAGWTSVTNAASAVAGTAIEQDSSVRSRQAISTMTPSQTMLSKTVAALAAITGVTRYLVLENYTGSTATDPNGLGLPAHSITCVVEGDTDANVANAIYLNRGIGCYTNGDVTETITDPITLADTYISFYRPTYVPIFVTLNVKTRVGYTSATTDAIKAAVVDFLNALQIYEDVSFQSVAAAAMTATPNLASPLFVVESCLIGVVTGTRTAADITIHYTEVAEGLTANVTVNLV